MLDALPTRTPQAELASYYADAGSVHPDAAVAAAYADLERQTTEAVDADFAACNDWLQQTFPGRDTSVGTFRSPFGGRRLLANAVTVTVEPEPTEPMTRDLRNTLAQGAAHRNAMGRFRDNLRADPQSVPTNEAFRHFAVSTLNLVNAIGDAARERARIADHPESVTLLSNEPLITGEEPTGPGVQGFADTSNGGVEQLLQGLRKL